MHGMSLFWDELAKAQRNGDLILFAGAGISMPAGLPSWVQLARALVDEATHRATHDVAEMNRLIGLEKLVEAISLAKRALGDSHFFRFVETRLDDAALSIPDVAHAIAEVAPSLRCIITTNIDRLIARALRGEWPEIARITPDLAQRRHYVLSLHGSLFDHSTWVFSRGDYDAAINATPLMTDYLGTVFKSASVLFVGFGHSDENIGNVFARIRALSGAQPPIHFALMRKDMTQTVRQTLIESGVLIHEYQEHAEVPGLIRKLAAGQVRSSPGVSVAPLPPPTIPLAISPPSAEEQRAAASLFVSLTKLAELVGRWKSISGLSTEQFQEELGTLWPTFVSEFREAALRMPSEFEWLTDAIIYLLSQLRASDASHAMFLNSNEGGAYAAQVVEEFRLARTVYPSQVLEVWGLFRFELKARANGESVRVADGNLDKALEQVLAAMGRVPHGAVEFANNPSLHQTALRAEKAGLLRLVLFGGKLVLSPVGKA